MAGCIERKAVLTTFSVLLPALSASAMAADLTQRLLALVLKVAGERRNPYRLKLRPNACGYDQNSLMSQQKQENQIKAVRSFIAQGVDGILLAPVVETGWVSSIESKRNALKSLLC